MMPHRSQAYQQAGVDIQAGNRHVDRIKKAISTTHTISTTVIGVGASKRLSAVRWGVAGRLVVAWVMTIPASAVVAALCYWLLELAGMSA